MTFKDLIVKGSERVYMLNNEALVRAALEEDVKVVSVYPVPPDRGHGIRGSLGCALPAGILPLQALWLGVQ